VRTLAAPSLPSSRPHRLVWALWAAALVIVIVVVSITANVIRAERDYALALAREALARTAATMAAHAEKVLADATHRLQESDVLLAYMTAEEVSLRLALGHGVGVGTATAVLLMNDAGQVIAPSTMRGHDLGADPLVRATLASGGQEARFGAPRESQHSGALVIPVARRSLPNAEGAELAYTEIDLTPFIELFRRIAPGKDGAAALFREDGMLMARQPFDRAQVGQVFSGLGVRAFQKADVGVVDGVTQTDGQRRLIAFHRAGGFPFFSMVAAERRNVLAGSDSRASLITAMAGLVCLLVGAGAAFATRQIRRDARQAAAMEASRAALKRLATIAEETQAAVVVTDGRGVAEWVNPAFTRNTGFTLADIVGRKPGEILQGPDTDPETAARIGEAVRNGEPFDVEIVNYTKDRRRCWIRLTGNPVREEDGTISRFIAVQTDITARREAEARAAEASRLSALGQLAGGVAHDMNNLLMVISLNLELLAESGLSPQAEGMAQAALGATMRGHDLTKQLLSFAQRAADPSRMTDIAALLGTIVPLLAKAMPEGIRFVTDLRCSGSCRVDAGALESALTNLVMNARDALAGRGSILVECARRDVVPEEAERLAIEPGAYMRLTVSDDGPGIPRELLGRVLEPFFTTKASGKGTGLGLSMAYGFARQAGGTLTIESTPGEGATVSLLLPLAQAAEAPCSGATGGQLDSVRGLSALIIDDEPQILVLLERMLRSAGIEVMLALEPSHARASLDARRPDVLLADVRLGGVASGIDVALAARARWPGLPVIFMTGDPGPEFAERIAGFEDAAVLQKPFGRAELIGAVKAAVPGATLALEAPA
jgi:PAS domain S-box-containing protein